MSILPCTKCQHSLGSNASSNNLFCDKFRVVIDSRSGCNVGDPIVKTNADRIRNMSDKDLADLLSGGEPYPWCEQDPCPAETCQECIMMWLNQEAKHDL